MARQTEIRTEADAGSADGRYRLLFESLSDPVLVVDGEDGRILEATPVTAPVYGYLLEELIGRSVTVISADPDQALADLRHGPQPVSVRVHRRRDGSHFPVEVVASRVEGDGRKAVILVAQAPALARRVVFMSGGAFTPRAADYVASVGNLQLEKPFDPVALRAEVSRLVAAARAGR